MPPNSNPPPRSTRDNLLGLLFSTGFMLILGALPLGLIFILQMRFELRLGWDDAACLGAYMTLGAALVGGLSLGAGTLIVRRRRRKERL